MINIREKIQDRLSYLVATMEEFEGRLQELEERFENEDE